MADSPEPGSVIITPAQIFQKVDDLDGKVDRLIALIEKVGDHENRIRNLEKSRWPLPAVSVLVAIAAVLVSLFRPFHS